MARFYNGQSVVCVDDRLRRNVVIQYPGLNWPRKGQRYVIRNACIPQGGKHTFVLIQEIRNRQIFWPCGLLYEAGFHEDRFEPATDIGDLERMKNEVGRFMGTDGDPEWDRKTRRRKKEDA